MTLDSFFVTVNMYYRMILLEVHEWTSQYPISMQIIYVCWATILMQSTAV